MVQYEFVVLQVLRQGLEFDQSLLESPLLVRVNSVAVFELLPSSPPHLPREIPNVSPCFRRTIRRKSLSVSRLSPLSLSLSMNMNVRIDDFWMYVLVCVYIYIEVLLILGLQSSRQRKACDRKKQMLVVGITCKGGAIENVRYPRATSSLVRYIFFFNNGIIKLTTWQIFYLQGMREQAFVISSCIFGQIIWGNSCVGTGLDWPEKSHGNRPKDFNRSIFFL